MATKQLLIKSLQRPYNRILFAKEVLNPVFGSGFTLFSEPVLSSEQPNNTELQVIQKPVYKYGEIILEDGTEVNCFEITLQPKVRVEQSRVAIQHFVRKLLTAGQMALVNFISPTTDNIWRLTLVAKDSEITEDGIKEKTTHSKRYTYLVEKDRPNRTLAERLEHLSLETVIDFEALVKAFSVETMSKAFFDEYKHHYQNFVEYLTGKRTVKEKSKWVEKQVSKASPFLVSIFTGNEKDARDFNKKLLGRIVFLYFVQKKRWLGATSTEYTDGSYDFIYQIFEETGGDTRFFPLGLTELFFNVLNKERPNNEYITPIGKTVKIPYLNGGLFNRDEVDEILHQKGDLMTFPPHLFSNPDLKDVPYERGFLDFLNAYNFTVYEDSPNDHTVAVDPEMLGHIFENLLEDNKDKGAYYTPKEIVSYMCRESLIEYLVTHLSKEYKVYREIGNDQVELFGNEVKTGQLPMIEELGNKALNRKDVEQIVKDKFIDGLTDKQLKKINQLLDDVKICDPAIGSGAFPMGLLQEIFTVKEMIAHELHWDWKPDEVKEHIIQNSIYGVDIEKGAVDIARLRFWLSLIVDIEKPKALPNLDYKIVVGDSLTSKVKIDGIEEIVEINWNLKSSVGEADKYVKNIQKLLKEVVDKQTDFFNPNARNKAKRKQEIRDLKINLLINQLKFEKEKYQSRSASTQDLFDSRKTKEQLDRELRISGFNKLAAKLEKLLKQPDKPFIHFDWMLDFPEVLNPHIKKDNVGFHIVIGNPPWVSMKGKHGVEETKRNPLEHLQKKYSGNTSMPNLYEFFIRAGFNLVVKEGVFTFIIPDRFGFNLSYTDLRKEIVDNKKVIEIVYKWKFETIIADTMTIIYQNRKEPKYDILIRNRPEFESIPVSKDEIIKNPFYEFRGYGNIEAKRLVHSIKSNSKPLSEYVQSTSGFGGKSFLITTERINSSQIEIVKGRSIERYRIIETLYFDFKTKNITGRTKDKNKLSKKEKILLRKTGNYLIAAYDNNGVFPEQSLYFLYDIEINPQYLLCLLNSSLFTWYYLNRLVTNEDSTPQLKNIDLDSFPIKEFNNTDPFESMATYIEFLKSCSTIKSETKLIISFFMQIVDSMVYNVYFPSLLKKHNREIIKHLGELPELKEGMSNDEKMKICKDVFNCLDDKSHPVRNNLFYMNSIPEIRLIEGKDENN